MTYALTLCVWKAKCHGVRRLEEIRPDTCRPKSTCHGGRRPDATCCDTRRLEEIRPDTCRLEEICLDTLRLEDICPDTRRPEGKFRGVRRPYATCLTLVDTKKRHRFDNRRLEDYCGAHLRLVCIRTANRCWERYVHWQVESGSICGGSYRSICLATLYPEGKCPDPSHPQEIYLDTPRLEGKMPWQLSSGRYMLWHSPPGKHLSWRVSSGLHMP